MKDKLKRKHYIIISTILLLTEIFITLFVNDSFIRPYGGDILVTMLLCAVVRIVFPDSGKSLPVWVFIFSVFVEAMQYFDIVSLLGLSHIPFFKILIGSVFSWADIICYGVGCAVFVLSEKMMFLMQTGG
ncbi:MAG: DUF2809 domain-containing protein [Eubacteriaceae bacterium]|nr:DUF2809 domain-containing protein [Eubacteriaceae bacterium]